jgi:hypothetical protein
MLAESISVTLLVADALGALGVPYANAEVTPPWLAV